MQLYLALKGSQRSRSVVTLSFFFHTSGRSDGIRTILGDSVTPFSMEQWFHQLSPSMMNVPHSSLTFLPFFGFFWYFLIISLLSFIPGTILCCSILFQEMVTVLELESIFLSKRHGWNFWLAYQSLQTYCFSAYPFYGSLISHFRYLEYSVHSSLDNIPSIIPQRYFTSPIFPSIVSRRSKTHPGMFSADMFRSSSCIRNCVLRDGFSTMRHKLLQDAIAEQNSDHTRSVRVGGGIGGFEARSNDVEARASPESKDPSENMTVYVWIIDWNDRMDTTYDEGLQLEFTLYCGYVNLRWKYVFCKFSEM